MYVNSLTNVLWNLLIGNERTTLNYFETRRHRHEKSPVATYAFVVNKIKKQREPCGIHTLIYTTDCMGPSIICKPVKCINSDGKKQEKQCTQCIIIKLMGSHIQFVLWLNEYKWPPAESSLSQFQKPARRIKDRQLLIIINLWRSVFVSVFLGP